MPDHVHLLASGESPQSDFKRFVSRAKQVTGFQFAARTGTRLWQRYSWERVLRDDEQTPVVVRYILENPVRAGLVREAREYPHAGSLVLTLDELLEFCRAG